MVYVGAVTILFLFVVMMLDIKQSLIHSSNYLTIGFLFVLLLFFILFNIIHFNVASLKQYELVNNFFFFKYHQTYISNINILGILLFNYSSTGNTSAGISGWLSCKIICSLMNN